MTVYVQSQYLPTVLSSVYSNSEAGYVILDKCVVTNRDVGVQTFALYIVPLGGAADNSNCFINRTIPPGGSDLCAEIIGQDMGVGDSIWTNASAASVLNMKVSGRSK